MTESLDMLKAVLYTAANISEKDFALSKSLWKEKAYKKGEFLGTLDGGYNTVGFITSGIFREFIKNSDNQEANVFFHAKYSFLESYVNTRGLFSSSYYRQAILPSTMLVITNEDLAFLVLKSSNWERFCQYIIDHRIEQAYSRIENLLLQTPEQRYLHFIEHHTDIFQLLPLYHLSSYLGIQRPSLSRIRSRVIRKK